MAKNIIQPDYIHTVKNIFSDDLRTVLLKSCDNHFKHNLLQSDVIEVTKCIIDCHGLSLSTSSYFPYSERCWNIFCLKLKYHVLEYFKLMGIDESFIVPHSCWAERSKKEVDKNLSEYESKTHIFNEDFRIVDDPWLKKHMIRSVYYLQNHDVYYGTDIIVDGNVKSIPAEQNSLVVFDGGTYQCSNKFPIANQNLKYNIVFDWYINDPFNVPDWILP